MAGILRRGGALKKISLNGGAPTTLSEAPQPAGAAWSNPATIVFGPKPGPLLRISDAGGAPQPLTRLEEGEGAHFLPEFLPDGSAVLFSIAPLSRVAVHSMQTGERRGLLQEGTQPRYMPSGHLVYGQGGRLMAVPFDLRRLEVAGTAVPMVEDVLVTKFNGIHQYSVSATGTLVYVSGGTAANQSRLVWVSRDGTEQLPAAPVRAYATPRISPDGRQVATGIDEQGSHTWVYDLARETLTRLTFEGSNSDNPVWTPDSRRLAFSSNREGPVVNLFWQQADGSGAVERLTTNDRAQLPLSFSPDGQLLAFRYAPRIDNDIWVLRLRDRQEQPFFQSPFLEVVAQFSPDGRWMAYLSNESGRWEVYVRPYPGPGGKWQISTQGGTEPVWSPTGRELFYRNGQQMMAVEITAQPGFSAGQPRVLFEGPYRLAAGTLPNYDVAPGGQRFLMLKPVLQAEAAMTQINVVQNWSAELKRRMRPGTN